MDRVLPVQGSQKSGVVVVVVCLKSDESRTEPTAVEMIFSIARGENLGAIYQASNLAWTSEHTAIEVPV